MHNMKISVLFLNCNMNSENRIYFSYSAVNSLENKGQM